ncbi:MAG: glycosyltransferase [Oscillospiraceae bacterium]|nr:glycosyltransferase [Oscillospiraceae bacterium]
MNIVFISNYFNHHQKPLSDELSKQSNYMFVTTSQISEERLKFGWKIETEPEYVCHYDSDAQRAETAIADADVIIAGSAPEKLVQKCIKSNKLVFRYSERPLKKGLQPLKYLPRLVKWHLRNPLGKKVYMLCASAYTAPDYAKFGLFKGKTFKWGYFPEVKRYDSIEAVIDGKNKASILWAGRFLDWKHPDDALRVASVLKKQGYCFKMNIIGTGEMLDDVQKMISDEKLSDCVNLLGAMKPEEVRWYMEKSQIYLFTSDRNEGWGAVLNESMNSGCAVVACGDIGAVPYLIDDGENGLIYNFGDTDELCNKVKFLLDNPDIAKKLGENAYNTITEVWNAEAAAKRFLTLAQNILLGNKLGDLFKEGPCSRA